jgi:hypothetical protein
VEVHLRGFDLFVSEPERDHGGVDVGVQEAHRRGVTQDVWRDRLGGQGRAALGGVGGVLGDPPGQRFATQRLAGAGRKQRLGGLAAAFVKPRAQQRDGAFGQWGDPLLAALAGGGDVRAGAQVDVAAAKAGQLRGPQPGLGEQRDDRVVTAAGPARAVGGVDERVKLALGEIGDQRAFVAFGSDLQDPFDRRGVLWVAQQAVAVEGADRREAGVARPGAAPAVGLEVIQERADQARVELARSSLDGSTPSSWDA